MNHDYAHCADFKDSCPDDCFRAQLVRDLERYGDTKGFPVSWIHLEGTEACEKGKRKKGMILVEMEMPKSCKDCPMLQMYTDCGQCWIGKKHGGWVEPEDYDKRQEWCPLKEVQG